PVADDHSTSADARRAETQHYGFRQSARVFRASADVLNVVLLSATGSMMPFPCAVFWCHWVQGR
ncbi:MAG: hypothetical protein P1V33_10490, partial [Pseudohongiella nitratireducens]